jgi:endonuclease IV
MNSELYIGCHLNTRFGFVSTADYAQSLGANFYQIFLSAPQNYSRKNRDPTELALLKKKLEKNNMKMVIHANFMLNFCNDCKNYKYKNAVRLLVADLHP